MAALRTAAAALTAAAFFGSVQAWAVSRPVCTSPFQPFQYTGCFQDQSAPTLGFRSKLSADNMTVEVCSAECKGNGFRYAGLEYYGVCFCGSSIQGAKLPEASCSYACNGDKTQKCGGSNILSVWEDKTFPQGVDSTSIADYAPVSCWTDDASIGRTLDYPQDQLNASAMTTELCLGACKAGGYPYAGLEYASQCWCGIGTVSGTKAAPESECNMPCKGDKSKMCGGPSRLSLYLASDLLSSQPCGYSPPDSSSSSSPSVPVLPPATSMSTPVMPAVSTTVMTTPVLPPASSTTPVVPEESSTTPVMPPVDTTSMTTPVLPPASSTASVESSTTPMVPPESFTTSMTTPVLPPTISTTTLEKDCSTTSLTTPVLPPMESTTTSMGPLESTMTSLTTPVLPPMSSTTPVVPESSTTPVVPPESATTPVFPPLEGSSTPVVPPVSWTSMSSMTSWTSMSSMTSWTSMSSWTSMTTPILPPMSSTTPDVPPFSTTSLTCENCLESSTTPVAPPESATTPDVPPPMSTTGLTTPVLPPMSSTTPAVPPESSTTPDVPPESTTSLTTPVLPPMTSTTPVVPPPPSTITTLTTPALPATSTAPLCTVTTTVPGQCEFSAGPWCATPVPEFNDVSSCKAASSSCHLQVAACFKFGGSGVLGWKGALACFDYSKWCSGIANYCDSNNGPKTKSSCLRSNPIPSSGDGKPPAATTVVQPCGATPTPPSPTSKCPIPTPTGICRPVSNPIGGIAMPAVTCNDDKVSFQRGSCFKLYTDSNTSKCPQYQRSQGAAACTEACRQQYDSCVAVYAQGCQANRGGPRRGAWFPRGEDSSYFGFKSNFNAWTDTYAQASFKCQTQFNTCRAQNQYAIGAGKCGAFGTGF